MRQSFISLGPVNIYFYGIFISLGCLAGYILAKKRLGYFGIKEKEIDSILILLFPFSILGARVYHVLSWLPYYRLFPKEIFSINHGGLGIFGAIASGLLILIFLCKRKNYNLLRLLDLLSLPLLACQSLGRLGNYFNREIFGPPTDLPWKIYIPPENRPINFLNQSYFHPTFLYEAALCLLAIFLLNKLEKKTNYSIGFSFGFYLMSYGTIRFFTEFLRFDTWQIQGIKVAQAISVIFMAVGIYLIRNGVSSKKLVK